VFESTLCFHIVNRPVLLVSLPQALCRVQLRIVFGGNRYNKLKRVSGWSLKPIFVSCACSLFSCGEMHHI
jgi:hypothetical protein